MRICLQVPYFSCPVDGSYRAVNLSGTRYKSPQVKLPVTPFIFNLLI